MRWILALAALGLGSVACIEQSPQDLPALDEPYFRCRVQPILDAKCSMLACHGDARRPFHTFARNRLRLDGTNVQRNLPLSTVEASINFDNTRGWVETSSPAASFLVLKPLDVDAGGYFHRGDDLFGGGDVFLERADPDFRTLLLWVEGATEDPACGGGA